MPKSKH
jgi:hypothetical protein